MALPLVASLPNHPILLAKAHDFAHAPLFGLVALLLYIALPKWLSHRRFLAAFALAIGAGALVELIQASIGRAAEWSDLVTDALGAAAVLAILCGQTRPKGSRWPAVLAGVLLFTAAGLPLLTAGLAQALRSHRFPVLLSAETMLDGYYLDGRGNAIERVEVPSKWRRPGDGFVYRVHLAPVQWSGISLSEPAPDWRGYDELIVELLNHGTESLKMELLVHDSQHQHFYDDRFNFAIILMPQARTTLRIPLGAITAGPTSRELDLGSIANITLFAPEELQQGGTDIYLNGIRLE